MTKSLGKFDYRCEDNRKYVFELEQFDSGKYALWIEIYTDEKLTWSYHPNTASTFNIICGRIYWDEGENSENWNKRHIAPDAKEFIENKLKTYRTFF